MTKKLRKEPTTPGRVSTSVAKRTIKPKRKAAENFRKSAEVSGRLSPTFLDHNTEYIDTDTADIDEIFKTAKGRPKAEPARQDVQTNKARKVEGSKDDIFALGQPKSRRYDPEGLPVYSPEELNVGAGGDTDQCPFDCTCCF